MRFKKKHNVVTGEDDYVLETKSERQIRESTEIAGGVFALVALLVSGLAWLFRMLFRGLVSTAEKLPDDAGVRVEKAVTRGAGIVAYVVLAVLAWPFILGLVLFLPAQYFDIRAEYLFLAGSVVYWLFAVHVIKKRAAISSMDSVSSPEK